MKRILAVIVAMLMMISSVAMATELEGKTTEELIAMIEQLTLELAELKGEEVELEPTPVPTYTEIARGRRVKRLKFSSSA